VHRRGNCGDLEKFGGAERKPWRYRKKDRKYKQANNLAHVLRKTPTPP